MGSLLSKKSKVKQEQKTSQQNYLRSQKSFFKHYPGNEQIENETQKWRVNVNDNSKTLVIVASSQKPLIAGTSKNHEKLEFREAEKQEPGYSQLAHRSNWTAMDYVVKRASVSGETVRKILTLIDEGNTIPFMAVYRKSITGGLDADGLRSLKANYDKAKLAKHRAAKVIENIVKQHKATSSVVDYINSLESLEVLDHVSSILLAEHSTSIVDAKSAGLGDPAWKIWNNQPIGDPFFMINPNKPGLRNVQEVTRGIVLKIAYAINKDLRTIMRIESLRAIHKMTIKSVRIRPRVEKKLSKKETGEDDKYSLYENFEESVDCAKAYRILAINRGEDRKILSVEIIVPENFRSSFMTHCEQCYRNLLQTSELNRGILEKAFEAAWTILIKPSLQERARRELTARARESSMNIFARNVKHLLLAPPVRGKKIIGIVPVYEGCKLVVLSEHGKVLEKSTLHLHGNGDADKEYRNRCALARLVAKYKCEIFAIGDGNACRDTVTYISELIKNGAFSPIEVRYAIVDSSVALFCSQCEEAKMEFPKHNVKFIMAISIARRLQDPMSELVKIHPKLLGVGMYQCDLPKEELDAKFDEVIMEAVSLVGVDVNAASASLLRRVPGLDGARARELIAWRNSSGPFVTRKDLMKVPGITSKIFEQCAGFMRIMPETVLRNGHPVFQDSLDYLDQTSIHPESYGAARAFVTAMDRPVNLGDELFTRAVKSCIRDAYKSAKIAIPDAETTKMIIGGLSMIKGRDVRGEVDYSSFRTSIVNFNDLIIGAVLPGVVSNVTDFGIFVDIGTPYHALIPPERMRRSSVDVRVGRKIMVRVLSIDKEERRFELDLI